MTTIYHTSPEPKITPLVWGSDLFGHAIFFSHRVYSMTAGSYFVHCLELDELKIVDDSDFESDFAKNSWEWQADIAAKAFDAGFDAVKSIDEQGVCYMIDVRKVHDKMQMIDFVE